MASTMGRRGFLSLAAGTALSVAASAALAACGAADTSGDAGTADSAAATELPDDFPADIREWRLDEGSREDRGFVVDNVLHTSTQGDLHFSSYVPDGYDGSEPYALYLALPGWEGLYFQGVGANLQEDFPFVARDYVDDMIVVSPQLDGWDQASAEQTIALTEWLLTSYAIDPQRVLISGNSGGGETLSWALGIKPELYAAALHTISRWDGDVQVLTQARVPVYLAIGEHDDYYGADFDRDAYLRIVSAYREQGLDDDQISELVVLDVKPDDYFGDVGERYGQHGGGGALFPHDDQIMGWLFSHV